MRIKDDIRFVWDSLKRSVLQLATRRIYLFAMIIVPLVGVWFFDSILSRGVSNRVPTAVVDLDHSEMSRAITRSLGAQEVIDITEKCESYTDAMAQVRSGSIFGFFVIPSNFEQDVFAGRKPTLNYYSNMTYFVPGTFTYKGFKTIAVSTAASVVRQTALAKGIPDDILAPVVQPVDLQINELHNPWTNYAYYLGPSFTYGIIQLMILLVTIFSITTEIKNNTSRQWLRTGGDSIFVSVLGKLLPQTIIFVIVGWACMAFQFGFNHYPMNGSIGVMLGAMALYVIACQAFGLFLASVLPNPRLALSAGALIGILSFSIAGISFPVQSMYGGMAIFSYILPMRYFFLTYITTALNGLDIYYSRYFLTALIFFIIPACLMLWNLKRACKKPVYVP